MMGARVDWVLELLVAWILAASGFGMAAVLAGHFLAPQVLVASLLLVFAYAWRTRRAAEPRAADPPRPHARLLVVLVLVALFFRLPAFNYVLGGQDEGVYVNISHYIEYTGGIKVSDAPLQRLQGSAFRDFYLAQNRQGGIYLPGVYLDGGANGAALQFQFYDLFPMWMALFIGLFGATFGIYALTLFAAMAVVFMYRLALAISGSQRAAFVAGLMLAVSPLHAFFSKFPVTEIPTLAFSLAGFTFLARFWSGGERGERRRWLVISAMCFGALFFTRISGFMYVPFVLALAVAAAVLDQDRWRQRAAVFWALGVMALYALSVAYGWHWSYHYSHDIYAASFKDLYGNAWKAGVGLSVIAASTVWGVAAYMSRSERGRQTLERLLVQPARRLVGVIAGLGLAYGVLKIYRLGWTSHYRNDPWLSGTWHLSGLHWHDVWASSLFALVVYMGLFVPLLGTFWMLRRHADPMVEYLRTFVAGFFVYVAVLQWVIPYGPYYTRYLLSELIYMMLLVVVVWAKMTGRSRRLVGAALVVSIAYMGLASAAQLGKQSNQGLYTELHQLVAPVDSGDLILLDSLGPGLPNNGQIKTPLVYTFHKQVISVDRASLDDRAYLAALDARYDDVYLITPDAQAPRGFESLGSSRVRVWDFKWSHAFPHKLYMWEDMRLYLYRLARPVVPLDHTQHFGSGNGWGNWLFSGWSEAEPWGTWSLGKKAEIEIDPRQLPTVSGALKLQFAAKVFVSTGHPLQRVRVTVDGVETGSYTVRYPDTELTFDVIVSAADLRSTRRIDIVLALPDAISPKDAGQGTDTRVIALGLVSVTATAMEPPAPVPADPHQAPR